MRMSTEGSCLLCGQPSNRVGMTRHLNTCTPAYDSANGHFIEMIRLRVDAGADLPYWMDLEVKGPGKIALLDTFLRKTWLVCDSARSRFMFGRGEVLAAHPRRSRGEHSLQITMSEAFAWLRGWFEFTCGDDASLSLRMRITNRRLGRVGRTAVRLLARNTPFVWPCGVCGEPAVKVCGDDHTLLCATHAKASACRKKAMRPVVDSPVMASLIRPR